MKALTLRVTLESDGSDVETSLAALGIARACGAHDKGFRPTRGRDFDLRVAGISTYAWQGF